MAKRKPARQATIPTRRRWPDWLPHAAALAALAVAVYANSIGNGFVGDDKLQLVQNPLLTDFANIPAILRSSVWSIIGIPGNYYRPLQFVLYMLLYKVAGFQAPAFHLFLVVLNAANTVLLYLFVRLFAKPRVAIAAAALFAAHPIHTEAVDWIACVPDVMLTTIALAGLLWFASRDATARGPAILGHCGIYLLALLTKETGAMVAPLYAAYGFLCQDRGWRELRLNARLYGSLAVTFGIYVAMRVSALGGFAPGQAVYFHLSPVEFLLSVVVTAAHYFRVFLWPATLNYFHVFYPTRAITGAFLVSALLLALLAFAFFRSRIALVSYGIFWAAVTLAPALNITGVGQNVFAERYLYLPSAGLCWIAGWGWDTLASRRWGWAKAIAAAVLLLSAGKTWARNREWRDDLTLLQVTVRQSPDACLMHNALAGAYVENDQFDKALVEERIAVDCEPRAPVFHKNLGNILLVSDPRAAVPEFEKVVVLAPNEPEAHSNLGLALEAAGDPVRAAAEYRQALRIQPENRQAREGLQRLMKRP